MVYKNDKKKTSAAAKQIKTQLAKLANQQGVDKKAGAKLTKISKLVATYESVELDEGVSLSKKGNYEVTVEGKSSVGIRIGLRFKGKLIVPGTKQKGMFVMGFNKADGKHKLPSGATIVKSSGKYIHIGFKKVDDIIAYAMLENIRERVSVDSRTKGYKEAVKRGIILAQKREAKKAKLEAQKQKEMEEDIANSTGVNIAGIDKPLGKVKKRKSFKESLTVL
jgi:hypothetical protein